MFFPIRFKTSIQLSPEELGESFDETIITKLKSTHEGICSRFGYIKPGSLEVVRRSMGMFGKQHFNGHIRFELVCRGEVCNPPQGMVVDGVVKNKNALGLLVTSNITIGNESVPVLDIIVPRKSNGISSEIDLDSVQIGDSILVMVMGKRYQLNDTSISIIGRAVKQRNILAAKTEMEALANDEVTVTDMDAPQVQVNNVDTVEVEDGEDGIEFDDDYSEDEEGEIHNKKDVDADEEEEEEELEEEEFDDDISSGGGDFSDGEDY
jgi:DNA-directed RNA polymerase subunit E'/Rpb7